MGAGLRAKPALGAVVVVALLVAFWLLRILAGGPRHALDAFEYHYPSYLWLYGELARGSLPLWNPYQLCGIPGLAVMQPGLLYPPHLLYLLLPTHLAMAISGWLHLALIGLSTFAFALRARLALPAAVLAAVLVGLRGAQPGHVINPSMQEAGAWLAVGGLGVLELVRGRSRFGVLLLASATGMSLLAGFPQLSVYSAYAWGFLLIALLALERGGRSRVPAALAGGLAGIALGALVAGVALLPALELVAVGGRERGVLPLQLMLPYGAVGFETPWRALQTALASRPAMPDVAFGFGWIGLLLLPAALGQRRLRPLAIACGGLGLLALVFALGPSTPLFDLLLRLPEVGSFRNPWRVLFVTDFCFALVAAIGLDALLRRAQGRSALARFAPHLAIGVLALAVAEIFLAAPDSVRLPYDASGPLLRPYHQARPVLADLANRHDRVWTWLQGDMGDVSEKMAGVFGFRSISDFEILTLRRQKDYFSWLFWGELEPAHASRGGQSQKIFYGSYNLLAPGVDVAGVVRRSRLVELAAARHLLVPRTAVYEPGVVDYLRAKGLKPVDLRDPQFAVFEDPRALPRVYLSHHVRRAPPVAELLALLSRPDFDPREESYVEAESEALPELGPAGPGEEATLVRDELHTVEIEVLLSAPGLLVLADSYYPGWRADIDGEPAPIFATNHLFRGVPVPAGRHRVVFRYRPRSVVLGAVASGLGIAVLAGLALTARRRCGAAHAEGEVP